MSRQDAIEKAARSLLNDIESMNERGRARDIYGPFSEWQPPGGSHGVSISWPNIVISAEALVAALESPK